MGALSRRKGKAFERELAKACRAAGFEDAARTLSQQRDSGEAPDVAIPGVWLEAKHHRKVPIRKAFEQAVDEVMRWLVKQNHLVKAPIPVAVTKDNGKEPLATLRLADFLALLAKARGIQPLDLVSAAPNLDEALRRINAAEG